MKAESALANPASLSMSGLLGNTSTRIRSRSTDSRSVPSIEMRSRSFSSGSLFPMSFSTAFLLSSIVGMLPHPQRHLPKLLHIVPVQLTDVVYPEVFHDGAVESRPPGEHRDVLPQERYDDLGPEHPCPAQLHPFLVHRVVDINLHAHLGVGEIRGPEPRLRIAHLPEKRAEIPEEMPEVRILVHHDALGLVEFDVV